ncbi:hypothetical protein AMTRI_Chr01g114710 [Amborella trichopoda]
MVGISCDGGVIEEFASIMGCKVGSFPITYLGLHISDSRLSITVWDIVLERVQIKLDLWKYKYLSFGGMVTLLKSCLLNLTVYQMSLINMSASVARKLEKMIRDFLWGSNSDGRTFHLLRWDRVCTSKKEGALLYKWWWRNLKLKNHLWFKVLLAEYGIDIFQMWLGNGHGREVSQVWKAIYRCKPIVSGYSRWNIRCGSQVFLWHHKWVGEFPLKVAFPDLFGLATQPNLTIRDAIERRGTQYSWNISLSYGRLSNHFLSQCCALIEILETIYVAGDAEDEIIWEIASDRMFSVKSCHNLLFHDMLRWSYSIVASIWKWSIPHKVQCFIWLAFLNRSLTIDNLIKRGKILLNVYLLCKEDGESRTHTLIHCPFIARVWY